MIFKVFYQEFPEEVPVRERTKVLFVEEENERNVCKKLADRNINIEYIQVLDGKHLEYEKNTTEDFRVEKL
ncbi:DNA-dependent RNA polymerase auxiliary subunit epsilon [Melghiribacillus thermohalophilus]|uniref:DNA-directed RNA polymerase subunit epsilon n=1 Tax=Melghiribacillus thermohalophilus TaxID=1324956 RepID=A0A4R3N1Q9_9BACI|nr:RNA polymerase epsilon subunit [Melghiribacillus thermohalophilus]TCT22654.1 DNA-dependent RNA polymerase auxiliary subunit epsilon [Melghiribacillus thermohalophilus]